MKALVLIPLTFCVSIIKANTDNLNPVHSGIAFNPNYGLVYLGSCGDVSDITLQYRRAIYEFGTEVYKRVAILTRGHFVFSPLSIWMSLAALAEGTDGIAREELFKLLRLPQDKCIRQQYYALASRREVAGDDVTFSRTRLFVFDEKLALNEQWESFICNHWLIGEIRGSLRRNPNKALQQLRNIFAAQIPYLDLNGNSVIMDALDYGGFWTTAFQGATQEKEPFHNQMGIKIGTVQMMRMKKHVKLAYAREFKIKLLELPIGDNGRYRMLFALCTGNGTLGSVVKTLKTKIMFEALRDFRVSKIPLEVAIPRFTLSSEYDMKSILEDLNVTSVWRDPGATRNISEPAALPSGFIHRTTITLEGPGLNPYQSEDNVSEVDTGLDKEIGNNFIADRPLLFAAFDAETYTCLFSGIFSRPDEV